MTNEPHKHLSDGSIPSVKDRGKAYTVSRLKRESRPLDGVLAHAVLLGYGRGGVCRSPILGFLLMLVAVVPALGIVERAQASGDLRFHIRARGSILTARPPFGCMPLPDVEDSVRTRTPEVMTRQRRFIENETSGLMRKPEASFPPVGFNPSRMRPVFVTMKTKIPAVPYTAKVTHCQDAAGNFCVGVEIRVKAPSRIVAMLSERGGSHIIPSAALAERDPLADVPQRARSWKRDHSKMDLIEVIAEGLDDTIRVLITVQQWHAIGTLCGALGITPGQWYLRSAAYNASIAEREITDILESLPAMA